VIILQEFYPENTLKLGSVSPWIAILMLVIAYIGSIFVTVFFMMLLPGKYALYISAILGEALLGIIPLIYVASQKIDYVEYLRIKIGPKAIILGIIFGIVMWLLGVVLVNLIYTFIGPSKALEQTNEAIAQLSQDQIGLVMMGIVMSSAGIFEEIALRGIIFRSLDEKYNFVIALFLSSLIFGFLHFDPQGIYIFITFIFGLLLGYLYKRYQNLTITILAHATNNLISLFLLALLT